MTNIKIQVASPRLSTSIQNEVTRRKELFEERDVVMHNIRRYRLMRHTPYVPKAYQQRLGGERAVKLPIMYRLIQTAVGSVTKRFPTVEAESLSAADRKAAEDLSRACSLLLQAVDNQSATPYLYGLYYTLFGDGLAVTKSLPGPWSGFPLPDEHETIRGYNERVQNFVAQYPLPFYTRVVDPLTFYPPLNEFGDGACVESAWRPTQEVLRTFNLTASGNDLVPAPLDRVPEGKPFPEYEPPPGMGANIKVDEVWTKEYVALVIQGSDRIFIFENQLGEVPYVWAFADPTGVEDPTNIGMSIAFPLYYLVPWIDTLVGAMAAWSMFAAPTPYTTQDPVPGVRTTTETAVETFQPGKMYHFATGRKPGVMQAPDVGRETTTFLNFLIEAADRGGLPALVSGGGVGTRLPALTFQAAFEAATDRLRPCVLGAEKIIAGTLSKWLNIVGRYEQAIKVNGWEYSEAGDKRARKWATIRPAEARKSRRIRVSLAVDSTQDLIAKGTHAQFMQSAQLWDMERAMRFSGVENPEETREKIGADLIWRMSLEPMAQTVLQSDPDVQAQMQQGAEEEGGGGEPPGPGRNRAGVPASRGGGRRGIPTQRPRGNRQGMGKTRGRS